MRFEPFRGLSLLLSILVVLLVLTVLSITYFVFPGTGLRGGECKIITKENGNRSFIFTFYNGLRQIMRPQVVINSDVNTHPWYSINGAQNCRVYQLEPFSSYVVNCDAISALSSIEIKLELRETDDSPKSFEIQFNSKLPSPNEGYVSILTKPASVMCPGRISLTNIA